MYIVMEASAKMPASCRSAYRRIAVVQISQHHAAKNLTPKMISPRARGVLRVITFPPVPANGKTWASGLHQIRAAARRMAYDLNNAGDVATAEQIIGAGGSA